MLLSRIRTSLLIGVSLCVLIPQLSQAMPYSPSAHSDIGEIELLYTPTPIPRATARTETSESSYWERFKNYATQLPGQITSAAIDGAYKGLRATENTGRTFGLEIDLTRNAVRQRVIDALSSREMAKYFPDKNEIETIANQIEEKTQSGSSGIIDTIDVATTETSGLIIDRILDVEGVKDPTRRQEWRNRMLAPFQTCISSAATYGEATECRSSFLSSAPANVTVAAAYEMARTELNDLPGNPAKETAAAISSSLKQCWTEGAEARKNIDCIRTGARTGVREIASRKIDSLVPAGVQAKDPKLKSLLVDELVQCVGSGSSKAVRAASGISVLESCKKDIALSGGIHIGSSLIPEEIDAFIEKRGGLEGLNMAQAERDELVSSTIDRQNQCFQEAGENENSEETLEKCLGTSIRDVSVSLGTKFLELRSRRFLKSGLDEAMKQDFRQDLGECLSGLELKNYGQSIDACETKLNREYTVKVARQALDSTITESLPNDENGRRMIAERLEKRFADIAQTTDPDQIENKVNDLERAAAFEIVTRAMNAEAKAQLKSDKLPKEFADYEENLQKDLARCLAEGKRPAAVCARLYAADIVKKIGSITLKQQVAKIQKDKKLKKSPNLFKDLEKRFHACIDSIDNQGLDADFKDAVHACVAEVEKTGVVLVAKNEIIPAITAKTRNKATKIKTEQVLGEAIGCLTELNGLGASGTKKGSGNISDLLKIVQSYYEYDTNSANRSLEAALGDVKKDLSLYGSEVAQENLLENMARHGVIDQLIKSAVRDQVKEGFKSAKRSDLPSQQLLNQILHTKNFDKIFTPAVMAKLRPKFTANILKPVLVQGKSLSGLSSETDSLKKDVSLVLAQSPHFGRMIANASVQKNLNKVDGLTRFFAHMMYGERALNWERVPESTAKARARDYIQNNLVYPKIAGTRLSTREEARRHKIAENLVTQAIKTPVTAARPQRKTNRRWIAREP